MSFFGKIARAASSGIHFLQKVPGLSTVAMLVPGGGAAIAAIGAADKVLGAVNSADPAKRKAGAAAVANTAKLAAQGNPEAARAMTVLGRRAVAHRVAASFRVDKSNGMTVRTS